MRNHAFMRRLAYSRGLTGLTFSTRDERRWPGYDKAWRAGARRRRLELVPMSFKHQRA